MLQQLLLLLLTQQLLLLLLAQLTSCLHRSKIQCSGARGSVGGGNSSHCDAFTNGGLWSSDVQITM